MTLLLFGVTILLQLNFGNNDGLNIEKKENQNKISLSVKIDSLQFKSGIRSLLQDSRGNYWLGSDQEGVCKYDGQKFTYYTVNDDLCGKQIISIKEDETGLIWFQTSNGLCNFDGFKFTSIDNSTSKNFFGNVQKHTWAINTTDLWFASKNNNELIRIDKGQSQSINYPFTMPVNDNNVDHGITGISKSKNGGLWIAHYSGVTFYNGNTIQYINDSTMHYDGKTKYMHVRSILEDSKGRLWIGNNGIGLLLKEKDYIIHFSEKQNLFKSDLIRVKSPKGLLMHVFAIEEDAKGNIWFGDRDTGVWRYDGKEMKNFFVDAKNEQPHIWDIYQDKNGDILFAAGNNGIYKFNGNGLQSVFK